MSLTCVSYNSWSFLYGSEYFLYHLVSESNNFLTEKNSNDTNVNNLEYKLKGKKMHVVMSQDGNT